jgi:hypothetical protein
MHPTWILRLTEPMAPNVRAELFRVLRSMADDVAYADVRPRVMIHEPDSVEWELFSGDPKAQRAVECGAPTPALPAP